MSALNELCIDAVSGIKDEEGVYSEERLLEALKLIIREGMSEKEIRKSLIQVSLELTTDMEPNWQFVASKVYTYELYDEVRNNRGLSSTEDLYSNYYNFIYQLTDRGLYGKYILENYTEEDILELEKTIKPERDFLFNYSGINLLAKRYLVQDYNRNPVELPQQMFMGIAKIGRASCRERV